MFYTFNTWLITFSYAGDPDTLGSCLVIFSLRHRILVLLRINMISLSLWQTWNVKTVRKSENAAD